MKKLKMLCVSFFAALVGFVPLAGCAGITGGSSPHTHQSSASGGANLFIKSQVRTTATCNNPAAISGTNLICGVSIGVSAGDLVEAIISVHGSSSTTGQSGWTLIPSGTTIANWPGRNPALIDPDCRSQNNVAIGDQTESESICRFIASASGTLTFNLNTLQLNVSAEAGALGIVVYRGGY